MKLSTYIFWFELFFSDSSIMVLLAFLFASGEHDELYARQKRQPILRLDPIKLSKGTVILKTKENGALKISVFNANQNDFLLADVIDSTNTISTCFATDSSAANSFSSKQGCWYWV